MKGYAESLKVEQIYPDWISTRCKSETTTQIKKIWEKESLFKNSTGELIPSMPK